MNNPIQESNKYEPREEDVKEQGSRDITETKNIQEGSMSGADTVHKAQGMSAKQGCDKKVN